MSNIALHRLVTGRKDDRASRGALYFPATDFPHLFKRVLSFLDSRKLISLRRLSRSTRNAIDVLLAHHLVVHEHRITPHGLNRWHPRLVHLGTAPLRKGCDALDRDGIRDFLRAHTRILDIQSAPEPYLVYILNGVFAESALNVVRTRVHPPTSTHYEQMWAGTLPCLVYRPARRVGRDPQGRNIPLGECEYIKLVHVLELDDKLLCAPPRPPARKLPRAQCLVFLMKPQKEPPHPSLTKRPVLDYFTMLLKAPPKVSDFIVVNCPPAIKGIIESLVRPYAMSTLIRVNFLTMEEYRSEVGEEQFALELEA